MAFLPCLLLSLVCIMVRFYNMPNTARCAAMASISCLSELFKNQETTTSLLEDRHPPMVKELSRGSISKTTLPPSFGDAQKCDDQSVISCPDSYSTDSEIFIAIYV